MAQSGLVSGGGGGLAHADDSGQGGRCGGGDGGVDADLVVLLVVDQLQAERLEQEGFAAAGRVAEDVLAQGGQQVQQRGVILRCGGAVQGGQPVIDLRSLGLQFGEPGD